MMACALISPQLRSPEAAPAHCLAREEWSCFLHSASGAPLPHSHALFSLCSSSSLPIPAWGYPEEACFHFSFSFSSSSSPGAAAHLVGGRALQDPRDSKQLRPALQGASQRDGRFNPPGAGPQ